MLHDRPRHGRIRRVARMLAMLAPAVLFGGASAAVAQDVTPPTLVSYSVSPAVVDVTTGDATLDITTQFTDDLSGFESAAVLYSAPGFVSLALAEIDATHRTSGDALSGTYMTSIVIPEYSKAGTWTVFSFNARDVQGNSTATPPAPASANFDVVSNEDLGAPSLVSIGASQSAIDVTTNPVDVTLTLQITDDISGFEQADVNLESPSGLESVFLTLDASDLIAGNALNGTYQRNAPFPQLSEAGTWIVESVMLRDAYGYSVTIPNASLPSPPTVDVSFSPDSVAPTLVSLSVDPSSVSLWAGPRTITFGVHLTDDVSGVASAGALLGSPVQEESKVIVFDAAHRISGDKFDGVYEVPVEFAAGDTLGAWTIEVYANDVATNYIQSSGGALPGPSVFFVSNAPPPPLPALGILSLVALASALAGAGALTVGKR